MPILWPFTRAYEVAKLERDAAFVCEDAERRFPVNDVRALAGSLRERIAESARRLEQPRMTRGNLLAELRGRHREARRRSRDRELSELTLTIIRLKSEELGAHAAVESIDEFLGRWPPAGPPDEGEEPRGSRAREGGERPRP